MRTFVIHARRTTEVLGRIVSLFHRRAVEIERLSAERAEAPNVLCVIVSVAVDANQTRLIEANLYKLVDVLFVESSNSLEARDPRRSGNHCVK